MKGFQEGLHRGLEKTDKAGSETGAAGAFDNPGTFRYNKRDYLPEKRRLCRTLLRQRKRQDGARAG